MAANTTIMLGEDGTNGVVEPPTPSTGGAGAGGMVNTGGTISVGGSRRRRGR